MSNLQQSPYLPLQQYYPQEDQRELSELLDKSYIEIASKVNERTIGLFALDTEIITGEKWFLVGAPPNTQQTLRKVLSFTAAGSFDHGINTTQIATFTKIYGTFTDGTNWYPLPYVDVVSATNQVNIVVGPTQYTITAGAGSPPSITSGYLILEWLSKP